MNQFIKDVLLNLLPLCPGSWKDLVFHGYFSGESNDFTLCFHTEDAGRFVSAFELMRSGTLPPRTLYSAYDQINALCQQALCALPEDTRWHGVTVLCDKNLHFDFYYEYEPENQSLTPEWSQKYLTKSRKRRDNRGEN